ncbi:hypothetical protein [Mucilaginibacter ginsenosidivorans]|uniref:Nucleotide-diphospho-sugar transferase domain-containing protein n=1 Tax=Mucilaginibacter ginsenosidivorans TaxID=398053 RepID=A0A5B8UU41_9SPHI|nr:hypothetical protein [Mucilaginibacter ginsenosidivorans]QEC62564.1 hypothetical protein FRZ54_08160 [Mucilaginibacter ginsenosidivorans]
MNKPVEITGSEKGILYVATGQKYVEEAIISATSCKVHNSYPIALITDRAAYDLPAGLFDEVIVKSAYFNYRDKLLIRHTPFAKTVFLDTDTYVVEPLDDLFSILDFREFAIHQADEGYEFSMPGMSNAMPEFNTGVIAFSLTPEVVRLFDDWDAAFDTNTEIKTDQYHLRRTLYSSAVRFAIFSSAYNFIVYYPNYVIQTVKVFHGRPAGLLREIAQDFNRIRHDFAWRRMYFPYNHQFTVIYQNLENSDISRLVRFNIRAFFANIYRRARLKSGKKTNGS